jgi:hypothetical protein
VKQPAMALREGLRTGGKQNRWGGGGGGPIVEVSFGAQLFKTTSAAGVTVLCCDFVVTVNAAAAAAASHSEHWYMPPIMAKFLAIEKPALTYSFPKSFASASIGRP